MYIIQDMALNLERATRPDQAGLVVNPVERETVIAAVGVMQRLDLAEYQITDHPNQTIESSRAKTPIFSTLRRLHLEPDQRRLMIESKTETTNVLTDDLTHARNLQALKSFVEIVISLHGSKMSDAGVAERLLTQVGVNGSQNRELSGEVLEFLSYPRFEAIPLAALFSREIIGNNPLAVANTRYNGEDRVELFEDLFTDKPDVRQVLANLHSSFSPGGLFYEGIMRNGKDYVGDQDRRDLDKFRVDLVASFGRVPQRELFDLLDQFIRTEHPVLAKRALLYALEHPSQEVDASWYQQLIQNAEAYHVVTSEEGEKLNRHLEWDRDERPKLVEAVIDGWIEKDQNNPYGSYFPRYSSEQFASHKEWRAYITKILQDDAGRPYRRVWLEQISKSRNFVEVADRVLPGFWIDRR